jgi:3-oxoacyl-[acyl-carrier-protein] synthase II
MTSNNGDPKSVLCPYDKRRTGYIFGEGAGTLILEEMEHAQRRGARIYAEILGFGLTNDAADNNSLQPEARDMIKAFRIALSHASVRPEDVEYICGHANSSVILDKSETLAIKKVFGDHAYKWQSLLKLNRQSMRIERHVSIAVCLFTRGSSTDLNCGS